MSPLLPDSLDLASSLHRSAEVCGCSTVAHDLAVSDSHGRVVVRPLPLDGLGAGCWREASVSGVRDAVDHVAGDRTVGGGLSGKERNGGDSAGKHHLVLSVVGTEDTS